MSDVRGDSWSSIADQKHIRTQMISVEDQRRMTDVMRKQGQRLQGVDEKELGRWWGEKGGTLGRKRRDSGEKKKELWGKRNQKNGHQHKTYAGEDKPRGWRKQEGSQGTRIYGKIRNHVEKWRMVRNAKNQRETSVGSSVFRIDELSVVE